MIDDADEVSTMLFCQYYLYLHVNYSTLFLVWLKSTESFKSEFCLFNKISPSCIAARDEKTPDNVIDEFKSKTECLLMEDLMMAPLTKG